MSRTILTRIFLLPLALITITGCASRTAPFDKLDQASVTILKLQAPQTQQAATPAAPVPGLPTIPGLPPELQQLGMQTLQQLQQQGWLPPGLLPGLGGQAGGAQAAPTPQLPLYQNQWAIADQRPIMDDALRTQLLDLFGNAESFSDQRGNCFYPGMAISFQSPQFAEPVDVVVSLSCNQAVGYGFQWPHTKSGFTAESHRTLSSIYTSLFGPVPPGA